MIHADLLRSLAPDFADVPLYVVMASELPPELVSGQSLGWTGRRLDLALQPWLRSTGQWKGRGPAIVLSDIAIRSHITDLAGDDPELQEQLVGQWTAGVLLHEAAHTLTQPFDLSDKPPALGMVLEAALAEWATAPPETDLPPMTGHGADWIRACLHLAHRYREQHAEPVPLSLVIQWQTYAISSPWIYQDLLGDEPENYKQLSFAAIRELSPPTAFEKCFQDDVAYWNTYQQEIAQNDAA